MLPATREAVDLDIEAFKRRTEGKLSGLRCPDHGREPRLRFHGSSLRDVTVQMSGCCQKLIALANQRIAERG